jgi:hypothetical protein
MLAANVVHFARVLRRAGLPAGPDRALAALAAIEAVGLDRRDDVHAALSAVMVDRHDQQPMFDAAFDAFWKDPRLLERLAALMLPTASSRAEEPAPLSRRLAEALAAPAPREGGSPSSNAQDDVQFDTALSFSERERLQRADFASMTTDEFAWARRIAATLPPPVRPVRQRRREAAARGRIDLRATLRRSARDPHHWPLAFSRARVRTPPIVVLLDISGSMERYARLLLHYAHGLARRHVRVHVFTFGTRLTDISRCLRHRDPDEALAAADARVADWRGGTRIGACLDEFNRRWARRVLGGNAAVVLVTDGLDRDDAGVLSAAAERLARMAHEVVWLNPLLRYARFEPRAAGIRALMPHVDRFLPVHNLASLADLARALRECPAR